MNEREIQRLEEIKDEIEDLIREAQGLMPNGMARARAESYWIPHILTALEKNGGGYLGGSMVTMKDTIYELAANIDD